MINKTSAGLVMLIMLWAAIIAVWLLDAENKELKIENARLKQSQTELIGQVWDLKEFIKDMDN